MQSYLVFLSELCRALDTLTGLEQRKITAVRAGDLEELDRCMKQEQAAALDLRGREQKRTQLCRQLGLEQIPLRELPGHCPPELKQQAAEITQQLTRSYQVLSSARTAARTLMESNLRHIERELERRENTPHQQSPSHQGTQTDLRV